MAARPMTWPPAGGAPAQAATEGMIIPYDHAATFELKGRPDGTTDFFMVERFSGLMLPLVKGSLPEFPPIFERYAGDLKREAERGDSL